MAKDDHPSTSAGEGAFTAENEEGIQVTYNVQPNTPRMIHAEVCRRPDQREIKDGVERVFCDACGWDSIAR